MSRGRAKLNKIIHHRERELNLVELNKALRYLSIEINPGKSNMTKDRFRNFRHTIKNLQCGKLKSYQVSTMV